MISFGKLNFEKAIFIFGYVSGNSLMNCGKSLLLFGKKACGQTVSGCTTKKYCVYYWMKYLSLSHADK